MNASKPEFIYRTEIDQLTQAILWLVKDVDNDIIASALHNVAFERQLSGTLFSREDILDSVGEVFTERYLETGVDAPDADIIERITDSIMLTDWWLENSLAVDSSFHFYDKVREHVMNHLDKNLLSDNILGEKENNV